MQRIGITVTGFPGSGSTTLGKNLASTLQWPPPYYSGGVVRWLTGEIERRGIDAVRQVSAAEVYAAMDSGKISLQPNIANAYKEFPTELDILVDQVQKQFLEEKQVGIHEGRVAAHLAAALDHEGRLPEKIFIKILCEVAPEIGAGRLQNREENMRRSVVQLMHETELRLLWERERYWSLYKISDHLSREHFDVIIDTSHYSPEEVLMEALRGVEHLHPGLLAHHLPQE